MAAPQHADQPAIIQGGMGVGVSGWRLARAVAAAGQLGVVSGVALDVVLARRLQAGDPRGTMRCALAQLPIEGVAERIIRRYFVEGGVSGQQFRPVPRLGLRSNLERDELIMAGNFVEVHLAKQGHSGLVGVNYLEKIQLATPAAAYGALLAGVDYVLMGAGIPVGIPALLDQLARGEPAELAVTVAGAEAGERYAIRCDPATLIGGPAPVLARPRFLAIVSSAVLATYLARNPLSTPDGFVLESSIAGGHSAPPRGPMRLTTDGEPAYGPRDGIDPGPVVALGRPFWLAGGSAARDAVAAARRGGATGIQVGTAFALCRQSGLDADLRRQLIQRALAGTLPVRNEPFVSPTGFPFKTVRLPGTVAEEAVYADRPRRCDLGYLRSPYRRADGGVGYRCPAEPVDVYVRKGGAVEETVGRRCLCNGLTATIGLGQRQPDGYAEPALVTLGQNLDFLPDLVARFGADYAAEDVVQYLLPDE